MIACCRDNVIQDLPSWCGSLVRYKKSDGDEEGGGDRDPRLCGGAYFAEGPLSMEQMRTIEPTAAFLTDDNSYYENKEVGVKVVENVYCFPDEGQVDPAKAVYKMRKEAEELGVRFLGKVDVTEILRDSKGYITGVMTKSMD
eukprot:15350939-Ditylum_brightwellii.AAC.1